VFNKEIMDKFGEAQHKIWADWMKFLFTEGYDMEDGSFKMKREKVERWRRQMNTPYEELTRKEQETDIKVAQDYLGDIMVLFVEESVKASLDNLEKDFALIDKEAWEEIEETLEILADTEMEAAINDIKGA